MPDRPTKITFAEMRDMGVRGLLVYCADYRCSHSIAISGGAWPDDFRLSDAVCIPGPWQAGRGFQLNKTPVKAMRYR